MHELDYKILENTFYIYEDLTPNKQWKTFVAFYKDSEIPKPVILKEMDEKRAHIYQALSNMWNPHIANVYSVHQLPNSTIFVNNQELDVYLAVTENVSHTSLTDYIRQNGVLSHKQALSICVQLCDGLSEFHKKGFVHRDIKPDNIMMYSCDSSSLTIKIVDFGGAKKNQLGKSSDTTVIGTIGYQAPESLAATTKATSDIFSIGCVLNYMLTGQEPGIHLFTQNKNIVSIIEKATNVDPSSRYSSVKELKKALLHELNFYKIDRIPIIRSIPGFRTHTHYKMIIGTIAYSYITYITINQWFQKNFFESFEFLFFYFFIPLIMIFNLGNILHFIPSNIRSNSKKFFLLRVACIVICLLIPLIRIAFFT